MFIFLHLSSEMFPKEISLRFRGIFHHRTSLPHLHRLQRLYRHRITQLHISVDLLQLIIAYMCMSICIWDNVFSAASTQHYFITLNFGNNGKVRLIFYNITRPYEWTTKCNKNTVIKWVYMYLYFLQGQILLKDCKQTVSGIFSIANSKLNTSYSKLFLYEQCVSFINSRIAYIHSGKSQIVAQFFKLYLHAV